MGTTKEEESRVENVESEKSQPKWFFVGMALFLIVVAITGFWPTYFGTILIGQVPVQFGAVEISLPVHIHTAIFMGWLFLLLTQTVLISKDHTQTHTKIGTYGMIYGLLIFAVGLIMTYVQMESAVAKEFASWSEAPFLTWRSFFSISQFATLLALGYIYRSSPEWHKRYMILATAAIVQAAASRMRIFLGPWGNGNHVCVPGRSAFHLRLLQKETNPSGYSYWLSYCSLLLCNGSFDHVNHK
jgi:hypothetical protein